MRLFVTERVLAPAPRVVPATFLLPPLIPRPPPLHAELGHPCSALPPPLCGRLFKNLFLCGVVARCAARVLPWGLMALALCLVRAHSSPPA